MSSLRTPCRFCAWRQGHKAWRRVQIRWDGHSRWHSVAGVDCATGRSVRSKGSMALLMIGQQSLRWNEVQSCRELM